MFCDGCALILGLCIDMRNDLMPTVCDHHSWKRKRRTLEGGSVTFIAITVWFNDSYIEMIPREDYVLLRGHICRCLYRESEANSYDQLQFTKHSFHKFVKIL